MRAVLVSFRLVEILGIALVIGGIGSAEAQAGLMAYWTFNDGSGTQLTDSSGRGNHGTLLPATNPPQWVPGHTGRPGDYALQFTGSSVRNDGNSPYVYLGNLPDLTITGDQTISMWLYPTDASVRRNPYAKAYGGSGSLTQETSRYVTYYYGTAGGNASPYQGVGSGAPLNLNQWNHIAVVRDLTNNQIRWYVNGVRTSTTTPAYNPATADNLDAYIGRGYEYNYHGRIDETAIFNHALSEWQIKAIAADQLSPATIAHFQSIRQDWLEGWLYRQPIVIKKDAVQANLTGFPVPIKLTDPNNKLFSLGQSAQGYDIVFTAADGKTLLPFEIERFSKDPGSEQLYAWVKGDLSAAQDTVIYMYYGGPAVGHLINNPQDTWDSNFRIVQHMEESAGATTFTDSTSQNRHMTADSNGATAGQPGIFYQAVSLGGYANPQYLRATGDSVPATSSLTIEGWAKITDDNSNQNQYPFSINARAAIRTMIGGTPNFGYIWQYSDNSLAGWNSGQNLVVGDDKWHYMVQVYDASAGQYGTMYLYLDGQLINTTALTKPLTANSTYYVGTWSDTYGWVPGTFDEFRISDLARSAAWIRANWLLLNDPQTYLLFGAQQYVPEPATGKLALLALVGLAGLLCRQKARRLFAAARTGPDSLTSEPHC